MKPRGPLMIEHRLIEKMLELAAKEVEVINKTGMADPVFIDTIVDFIRTYADRTHHGKEEDILFRDLDGKELSQKDNTAMRRLIDEHTFARKTVGNLVEANTRYKNGDESSLAVIVKNLKTLIEFYPDHIRREDKEFFPDTEIYFTEKELDNMLADFHDFDRKMIHEKYQKLFDSLARKY